MHVFLLCYCDVQQWDWSMNLYWFPVVLCPLELFQHSDISLLYQISWHSDHNEGKVEPSLSNYWFSRMNETVSKHTEEAAINNVVTASLWAFCKTSYLGVNSLGLILFMTPVLFGIYNTVITNITWPWWAPIRNFCLPNYSKNLHGYALCFNPHSPCSLPSHICGIMLRWTVELNLVVGRLIKEGKTVLTSWAKQFLPCSFV